MSSEQRTSGCSIKRLVNLNFHVMQIVTGAETLMIKKKYAFFMEGTTFIWLSKKQSVVTLSTCEVEYVVASLDVNHAI
jgi:hypothetical protein